jgi:hypothetical protein
MERKTYANRRLWLLVLSIVALLSCSRPAPFVSSPTDEWEEVAERGRMRMPEERTYPTPYVEPQDDRGTEHVQAQKSTRVETAFADIIGFPFRAAAWLAHVLL